MIEKLKVKLANLRSGPCYKWQVAFFLAALAFLLCAGISGGSDVLLSSPD